MSEVTGSTVPRRQLGRELKKLRLRAGFTIAAAAKAFEWSDSKMNRIEFGRTGLRALDVKNMLAVYGASSRMYEPLMALARESKSRGWWHSYGDVIPEWFDVYIGLEEAATGFRTYEAELVPGIFQTEDYARTVAKSGPYTLGDDEIEKRVKLRIRRQSVLTRMTDTPTWEVVLNEAVLRRPVGGNDVMAAQIERLREISDLENVTVTVVPFIAGFHVGATVGPFVWLSFPPNGFGQPSEPDTIYVEGFTGALYLDDEDKVAKYRSAFAKLQSSALDEKKSKKLLTEIARDTRG